MPGTERIDFYVLDGQAPAQRWTFACRLAAKAYQQNLRVIVWNETAAEAKTCDDMLWTFNDGSIVPHQISAGAELRDRTTPVHLTLALDGVDAADLLINLADRLPDQLPRFARVAEIINADPERRRLGRERFKAYREAKLELQTHQVSDGADG
jgi:DNA polymerase-3 subunit chi